MLSQIFIKYFIIKLVYAQFNGDFWWLNDKLAIYTGTRPPPPKFENLSEFDTDENARIIFKDSDLLPTERDNTSKINKSNHTDDRNIHNLITWPEQYKIFYNDKIKKSNEKQHVSRNTSDLVDSLIFEFSKNNNKIIKGNTNMTSTTSTASKRESSSEKILSNDVVTFYDQVYANIHRKDKISENSCTFMKKSDCNLNKGFYYNNIKHDIKKNSDLICCTLSFENRNENISSRIYFPGDLEHIKRPKRSDNIAQKQRNILLQRRYANRNQKRKPEIEIKIATPDYEYDDPYWNIRNAKSPKKQRPESVASYSTEDYVEDYSVELPTPGLTGIYSDNEKRPPGWISSKPNKGSVYGDTYDNDDDYTSFGYSTIDPRIESGATRKSKPRVKPMRVTTTTEESPYDAESQTISYQSNPDFNVLQGFKLLNLLKDKNKSLKISRSTTTESFSEYDDINSQESILNKPLETSSEVMTYHEDHQVFKGCGRGMLGVLNGQDKPIGYTQNGSHPWLSLLVPSENLNSILCYASLIHPRVAITAADCVYGSFVGEITLISGLRNFNKRMYMTTRVVSFLLHPKYKNQGLDHNLAILHWTRPLKLGTNVWPVCLSNPHLDDDCMFVGWGGFDQAIRSRSRWQRTSIHSCKDRLSLNGVIVPSEAFCASVRTRSTVTGIGGSLVCNVKGHASAVGVAVSRDSTLVLLPVYGWVREAIGHVLEQ